MQTLGTLTRKINGDLVQAVFVFVVLNFIEYGLDVETGLELSTAQHLATYVRSGLLAAVFRFSLCQLGWHIGAVSGQHWHIMVPALWLAFAMRGSVGQASAPQPCGRALAMSAPFRGGPPPRF
jgi:hypothetical protein